jgi:hypothetical protein
MLGNLLPGSMNLVSFLLCNRISLFFAIEHVVRSILPDWQPKSMNNT